MKYNFDHMQVTNFNPASCYKPTNVYLYAKFKAYDRKGTGTFCP